MALKAKFVPLKYIQPFFIFLLLCFKLTNCKNSTLKIENIPHYDTANSLAQIKVTSILLICHQR